MYLKFEFSPTWYWLDKTAKLYKSGCGEHHIAIDDDDDTCQIPNVMMETPGTITVSVYAGDRHTVDEITINVVKSGYDANYPCKNCEKAPSGHVYVQSPSDETSITAIRYIGGKQQGLIGGKWVDISGGVTYEGSGERESAPAYDHEFLEGDWETYGVKFRLLIKAVTHMRGNKATLKCVLQDDGTQLNGVNVGWVRYVNGDIALIAHKGFNGVAIIE